MELGDALSAKHTIKMSVMGGTTVQTAVRRWTEKGKTMEWIVEAETLADLVDGHWTASTKPLVRCKDCKWYGRADKRRFYRGMDCLQKRIDTIIPDKDFCSRGERKRDN